MANSFRSRSSSFTQRRGARFLGGMSGRAGIPSGREPFPRKTVSYPCSVNSISTTIKFLPCKIIISADLFPPLRFSLFILSSIWVQPHQLPVTYSFPPLPHYQRLLQHVEPRLWKYRMINVLVHSSIFERTVWALSESSITPMLSLFKVQTSPTQ